MRWGRHEGGQTVSVTEEEVERVELYRCTPLHSGPIFAVVVDLESRQDGQAIWAENKIRDEGHQSGRWEPPLWRWTSAIKRRTSLDPHRAQHMEFLTVRFITPHC